MTENPAIRAAFEAWAKGRGMRLGLSRRGNYVWPATSFAWKVWQASLAALPPPGRGMVPMTTAEIDLAVRNAQIAFALDKFKTFEEALVRKAEAHHGIKEGS